MLKLTVIEFVLRTIPEAFALVLASYALSNHKINIKRYIVSSILFALSIYFIRMLPINYGVHSILNIIIQTVILISINKIDIIPSIKASIITFISLFIIELLNMLLLTLIFKERLEGIMSDTVLKTIGGLPSLLAITIISLCYYYNLKKKDKLKYV